MPGLRKKRREKNDGGDCEDYGTDAVERESEDAPYPQEINGSRKKIERIE